MNESIVINVREDGSRVVKRNLQDIGTAADGAADALGTMKNILLGIVSGGVLAGLMRMADTYTTMQNKLRLVTSGTENLARVTKELLGIANQTRTDFEATTELYGRMANSSKELGLSQKDLLRFTKSINQAITLSGASAEEAAGGLRQLSQGMAAGTLRGDELNSVMENFPKVADVIAKGLGVTRGELRAMGADGKIAAKDIIEAFQKAEKTLDEDFAKTVPTIGQAFTVLKNNVLSYIGQMDQALGVSKGFAEMMLLISGNINILLPLVAGLGVAIAVAFAPGVIMQFWTALKGLWVLIAANPFVALAAALAGVVTVLYTLRDEIKLGIDETTTLGDLMRAAWEEVVPFIKNVWSVAKWTLNAISEYFGTNSAYWASTTADSTKKQESSWLGIVRAVARTVDAILGLLLGLHDNARRIFAALGDFASTTFTNIAKQAAAAFKGDFAQVLEIGGAQVDNLKNTGVKLGEALGKGMETGFAAIAAGGFEAKLDKLIGRAQEIGKARGAAGVAGDLMGGGPAAPPKPPKNKDGADKAARELERLRDALRQLRDAADPVGAAMRQLADDQATLDMAVSKHLITQKEATAIYEELKYQMRDQLDPLAALNRSIDESVGFLKMSNDQRTIEQQMLQYTNQLRKDGKELTDAETEALRAKLIVEQELAKIAAARDSYDSSSLKGQLESFTNDLKGFQASLAGGGSGQGDVAGAVSSMLPWANLQGSQEQMTAYVEQHAMMYQQIKALSDANIINHQTANSLMMQADAIYMEQRLQGTRALFGALAGLSSSGNRKLAAIGKAAAVADAVISGILATQKALAAPPGPPYTIPMAAITAGMAAVNVAKIVSTPLPGFRTGGEFRVGGSGGEDSQTVAFRGSPNETVSIKTPQQMRDEAKQMSGNTVIKKTEVHVHVPQTTDYRSSSQIGQYAAEGVSSGSRND